MKTLYQESDSNKLRTVFLMSGFFIFFIVVGYLAAWYFNDSIILWIAVIFSVVSSFISYWWSDKIILQMAKARPIDRNNGKEIYRLVENLCIAAGLPIPKIYLIEDSSPNAFATGRNPKHSAIALTSGLLASLEKSELEGVIAHELSHIGNRDILISTVATVLVGAIAILSDLAFRSMFWSNRRSDNDNNGGNAAIIKLLIFLVLMILAPLSAKLLSLAISRRREFLADSTAALLTRYPEGLARALEKISSVPQNMKGANAATAHMYIVAPLQPDKKKDKSSVFKKLFMTHPPIAERVARLREAGL
ncbi:MAG: M48 family metalloprotease [Patescibacteria group bacterium]|jgi:heat shock protein HtpX|nr:M48 family metalloprotease [Patescibacteria group bacterium]MDD3434965.1 M48 family metalloprotease [Patescibacteria group bacterium]MDD4466610.1 M48 family metalloprotease [Patescibacteria group bacterium]